MDRPDLPADLIRQPGLDVDDLFDRFEVFEALHHGLRIASPMSGEDLDTVVDLLCPADGDRVLDLACGGGELLLRLAERAHVVGTGVDVSPWMIASAHEASAARGLTSIGWALAEAQRWGLVPHDVVACLGASWVWHGIPGTVRAVSERAMPGGRVAIGDMGRRDGVSAAALAASHGPVPGEDEVRALFDAHGLDFLGRVVTSDDSWDQYIEASGVAFERWSASGSSSRVEEFRDVLAEWEADQRRDREVLAWSVWVGRKRL